MLINLSGVLSEQHTPIDTDVSLDMTVITLPSGTYPVLYKQAVHLEVVHIQAKELTIRGNTRMMLEVPCDRCLQPVEKALELEFTKAVNLNETSANQTSGDETNYMNGYYLDVDQLLFNEILIGWPMKILCCDDCKGICNVCGQHLNEGACDCEDTSFDPRMSVIRDLF